MRVAVRVLELSDPFQIPPELENYEGVRIYYSVAGQIKGHITLWNPHKALWRAGFQYASDYGNWLPLLNSFFSEQGRDKADLAEVRNTFCKLVGLATTDLTGAYRPVPPTLPPLSASIVIPTKDRPLDLARALQHLTSHQTGVQYEIIVVDNNPASGLTEPVVNQFPGVRCLSESRPGVGYARNAGTLAARGDIIICTDDDVVVGEGWLDQMVAPFADPQVGAVMGLVLPFEINTRSQKLFEADGGLNLGYEARRFDKHFLEGPDFPDISKLGNTSSAAFRRRLFADPRIGPFEVALGSGTLARGGGDVYQFYRTVAAGWDSVYQPQARVFHRHRVTMKALRTQLISFECGYTAMLWHIATRDRDRRAFRVLRRDLPLFQWRRLRHSLADGNPVSGLSDPPANMG